MARKDISDKQCVEAAIASRTGENAVQYLHRVTGECEKVCYAALERAYDRDLIECGVSIRYPWPTDKGRALL